MTPITFSALRERVGRGRLNAGEEYGPIYDERLLWKDLTRWIREECIFGDDIIAALATVPPPERGARRIVRSDQRLPIQ